MTFPLATFLNFRNDKICLTFADKAVPANKVCGLYEVAKEQKPWRDEPGDIFTFIDRLVVNSI